MHLLPYQLESVVLDMHKAREAGLYYPCLLVALTLPEICSGLALPKSSFVKRPHYVSFVDTYSSKTELGLTGSDCYNLRGGVVHRGDMTGHAQFDATHVIFSVPESNFKMHAFKIEAGEKSAAMLDLNSFVGAMDAAVRRWSLVHSHLPQVIENLPNLIRYSPSGVSPFTKGSAAIVSGD